MSLAHIQGDVSKTEVAVNMKRSKVPFNVLPAGYKTQHCTQVLYASEY